MRKARSLQGHGDTVGRLWDALRLACVIALVACGLAFALAAIDPEPARADGSGECLESEWTAEVRAFVIEETGIQVPKVCVRLAQKERLDGLVFPMTLGQSHAEAVAAVYVPATREILLADDLDPGTPLARSFLVHELVHAQQFATRTYERASCPGVLETDAYSVQALYLRTKGLREEALLLQALGMLQGACGNSD